MKLRTRGAVVLATALLSTMAAVPASAAPASSSFVTRSGNRLLLAGKPFRFAGTNNYYLHYQSAVARDNVIDKAAASGFTVLRTWGWFDTGTADGTNPTAGSQNGVYFQYWDGTGHPKYNDGPDGLERLDAVVAKAKEAGVRLVIPFTNNWGDFGGMDRYVEWAGGSYHDDFYTDATIRGWFRDYIAHVLNRTNTITGIQYKNDPTIMAWDLANEPRCVGSGRYPRSSTCTTDTVTAWADEMSTFIKSVDRKHLVTAGDEGFFNDQPGGDDWTHNGADGVDTVRLASLKNIDLMSYHLYPDHWGKTTEWSTQYILDHAAAARRIGKPVMLGEFGLKDKTRRNAVYQEWTDAVTASGQAGALYWILSDKMEDGSLYGDYDGFTTYCPSPVCTTLGNFSKRIRGLASTFPPVADDDGATVEFGTTATVAALANDIVYRPATRVVPSTVRLSATAVTGGTFAAAADGTVSFVPADGFYGRASTTYTVADNRGRRSAPATITVTVKPEPGAALKLFDFESGVQGWAPANFNPDAGTTATSTEFKADGAQSLRLTGTAGGWFGTQLAEPIDLSKRATLTFASPSNNGSFAVSFQTGDAWTWCQGDAHPTGEGIYALDLTALAPGCPTINVVHTMNLYIGGGQDQWIDAVTVL
ncbi:cellulase family glycosylhydrolase [Paractinoplanes rishiriensis]|uniref:mannan endo-1,4-beta-mannosidase n=1 Tax=Paractinoplanes rishiriensis TaxID=1050105 RepID=A0A919JVG0_9ACTN|nr:cellulase family glycosylhydrolase [Actinoplanes rishiriensis]GIE94289.1 hypothetical protein Ari01nite_17540 [Actinoplanes rishiriensis]